MEIEQCKENLELMAAQIEWDCPIDHQVTIEVACKYLEELQGIKEIIERWNDDIYGYKGKDEYFDMILDVVGEYHG